MKRKELAPRAEHLYVYNQKEFAEIAAEVGVHERTLRTWASRDDWKGKRQRYLNSKEALDYEFTDFARYLLRDVFATIKSGEEPSRTKVSLLNRFIPKLMSGNETREGAEEEQNSTALQDPLEAVKQYLGL